MENDWELLVLLSWWDSYVALLLKSVTLFAQGARWHARYIDRVWKIHRYKKGILKHESKLHHNTTAALIPHAMHWGQSLVCSTQTALPPIFLDKQMRNDLKRLHSLLYVFILSKKNVLWTAPDQRGNTKGHVLKKIECTLQLSKPWNNAIITSEHSCQ